MAASGGTSITFPDGADEVLVPMTQMRKGIAAQMTKALLAPHAYVQMEVDVTRLVAFREREKRDYQAKEGIGLSFVPFVVKASAEALKRNPTFNAHWTEQGLMAKRRINVGVAVAVDEGLIVPVIRDADQLSIHGLNVAIADVAEPRQDRQVQDRRLRWRHVHGRQHRLPRDQPGHADPQRPRGRDRHDGGDHEAPGRRLDARTAT